MGKNIINKKKNSNSSSVKFINTENEKLSHKET